MPSAPQLNDASSTASGLYTETLVVGGDAGLRTTPDAEPRFSPAIPANVRRSFPGSQWRHRQPRRRRNSGAARSATRTRSAWFRVRHECHRMRPCHGKRGNAVVVPGPRRRFSGRRSVRQRNIDIERIAGGRRGQARYHQCPLVTRRSRGRSAQTDRAPHDGERRSIRRDEAVGLELRVGEACAMPLREAMRRCRQLLPADGSTDSSPTTCRSRVGVIRQTV